jgi:hypothetical protein
VLGVQALEHPVEDGGEAVGGAGGDGLLDVLALAAVALRGTTMRRAMVFTTALPSSRRTTCRQASMPAAVPALVTMSPSST